MLWLFLLALLSQVCVSFRMHYRLGQNINNAMVLMARERSRAETPVETKPAYQVGENLPDEISKHRCIYDMILVERYSTPERTSTGLFLPVVEGKDQKHLGKVLSMPQEYGLESEQGRVQPIHAIAPFKIGDLVYIKVRASVATDHISCFYSNR